MPFSFLHPLFWLGALALAAPIWLHLRRRQEKRLVRFSALQFLDDLPEPRRSPLRLRDLILLAARILALLAIVAAFAWPYSRDDPGLVVKESRVYLLDNTLSHQAHRAFDQARSRLLRELSTLGPETQAAVVELTSQPRVLANFGDDREAAQHAVAALQPSHQRGSYLSAFRQAAALLENSLGARKRIIFYTDNQENQWTENLSSPPFLSGVEIEIAPPAATNAPNLSVADPEAQRVFLGERSLVQFTAKVTHEGAGPLAEIQLRAHGQTIFRRSLNLSEQPPAFTVQAQWEADPKSWVRGEVSIEGSPDALPADNRVFFNLPPVREGKVLLLAQSPYLRLALAPEVMRGYWQMRLLDPTRLKEELAADLDAEVLVLESHYLQSGDARALLWRYLTNRRGALVLVNKMSPIIAGALRELGFEPGSGNQASASDAQPLTFFLPHHPVFRPFRSPDFGNLAEVRILRNEPLKSREAIPLLFSGAGQPVLFQGVKFPGTLFVASFGLERDQTTWPFHPTFIPFLDLCLQSARTSETAPAAHEPGAIALIELPPHSKSSELLLQGEQGELVRLAVTDRKVQVRLPDQPGLYELRAPGKEEPDTVVSVNPSPRESQLVYTVVPEALRVWKQPATRVAAMAPPVEPARNRIFQQRFWWCLLVGGLILLALESAWANRAKELV